MAEEPKKDDLLDHAPEELQAVISDAVPLTSVQAAARHDLDEHGMYVEGYLVLTESRLGHFLKRDEGWRGHWTDVSRLSGAIIVEGLGMNLLRLLADGKAVGEFRFTLRQAREVAKLQRRLERRIEGKEADSPEAERPRVEEKKVRCDKCGRVIPPWSEVCPACLSRRKVLSRLMDFVRPYKWQAIAGMCLAVLATTVQLFEPYLRKPMLDKGLGLSPGHHADYSVLLFYVVLLAVLVVCDVVMGLFRERLMAKLASRMGRDVRDRIYGHIHKLSLSFFSRKPTGTLVTRVTSDSDRIFDFVAFTIIEAIIALLTIGGVGVALFAMNWKLACAVLMPIPIMSILTIFFHKRLHRGFLRLWHRWSQMTAVVADSLPGVRVIKAFSQERREVERFGESNWSFYDGEVGMVSLWTLFRPVMQFCAQLGVLLVWIVGGWWAVKDSLAGRTAEQGAMTAGTLMAYMGYMGMFYRPIHMVAHMDRMFNRAATSVQRIFEVLDTEPAIFSKLGAVTAQSIRGEIELRNVTFTYDGVRKVLRNINLKIAPGEMVGLAGPSGGGKTTMVNLICRFYDVLEGQIFIDGVDLRDYDIEQLRHHIGVVLQDPFLFHGTVAANIAYGNPQATLDQIITAAKAANAHDFIVGFPDGYDTLVGERGHTLSGGERQRISIARAILNNPTVLILDEATSSVDTETEKLIQEALDHLIANRTTIAIAHRLSTLRKADRLVILDKGEIIELGSHEELSSKEGGVYAKLLRMQTEMQSIIAIA
ncbi:MAG: ABC transporter ATP-binding protein/permease [Phycisphaerae bacterium]|nr:ABC transporter ATP-binding protein/permease [Phycisphaerae bacterium]